MLSTYSQSLSESELQVGPINQNPDTLTNEEPSAQVAGSCWTPRSANAGELVFGLGMVLIGVATIAFGVVTESGAENEIGGILAYCGFGSLIIGMGLFILLAKKCSKHYGLEATSVGFDLITKRSEKSYRWDEIERVLVGEFTPNRASQPELFLTMYPKKGKPIKVRSSFEGDPDIVLGQILTHCDYIVRNPEAYNKNQR